MIDFRKMDVRYVDIASLILRLYIGYKFSFMFASAFQYIPFGDISNIIKPSVDLLAIILITVGLFTNWVTVILILTTVTFNLIYFGFNGLPSILSYDVVIFITIWLLGPGIYSLDYLRKKKKSSASILH